MLSIEAKKRKADDKYKQLMSIKREIVKLEEKMEVATKRVAFSEVNKLENMLAVARSSMRACNIEVDKARLEAYGDWVPHSLDCTDKE